MPRWTTAPKDNGSLSARVETLTHEGNAVWIQVDEQKLQYFWSWQGTYATTFCSKCIPQIDSLLSDFLNWLVAYRLPTVA